MREQNLVRLTWLNQMMFLKVHWVWHRGQKRIHQGMDMNVKRWCWDAWNGLLDVEAFQQKGQSWFTEMQTNRSALCKSSLLVRSPWVWKGPESSIVPHFEAMLQVLCWSTEKETRAKEQERGDICNTLHMRRELLISGKKRLSRDFQCFFNRSKIAVKRNEVVYSLRVGARRKEAEISAENSQALLVLSSSLTNQCQRGVLIPWSKIPVSTCSDVFVVLLWNSASEERCAYYMEQYSTLEEKGPRLVGLFLKSDANTPHWLTLMCTLIHPWFLRKERKEKNIGISTILFSTVQNNTD